MPAVRPGIGKIKKLYVDSENCFIELKDLAVAPLDGYFKLKMSHPGYDSIYSLLLTALANNLNVAIRPHAPINPGEHAIVSYVVVHA
jgi:hypothetical protein